MGRSVTLNSVWGIRKRKRKRKRKRGRRRKTTYSIPSLHKRSETPGALDI